MKKIQSPAAKCITSPWPQKTHSFSRCSLRAAVYRLLLWEIPWPGKEITPRSSNQSRSLSFSPAHFWTEKHERFLISLFLFKHACSWAECFWGLNTSLCVFKSGNKQQALINTSSGLPGGSPELHLWAFRGTASCEAGGNALKCIPHYGLPDLQSRQWAIIIYSTKHMSTCSSLFGRSSSYSAVTFESSNCLILT